MLWRFPSHVDDGVDFLQALQTFHVTRARSRLGFSEGHARREIVQEPRMAINSRNADASLRVNVENLGQQILALVGETLWEVEFRGENSLHHLVRVIRV